MVGNGPTFFSNLFCCILAGLVGRKGLFYHPERIKSADFIHLYLGDKPTGVGGLDQESTAAKQELLITAVLRFYAPA